MYTFSEYQPYRVPTPPRPATSSSCSTMLVSLLKPIVKFCRDFCLWTSMHGFNHIAAPRRHWFERLLWVAVTALAIWGAIDISLGQLQRYNDNPTVVVLEKDFRSWRRNLPAITACHRNKVDPSKLPEVIKSFWNVTPEHSKYEYYSNFVSVVANSDLYHLEGFQNKEYEGDDTLNVDMFKLAVAVQPEFSAKVIWSDTVDPPLPDYLPWTPVMIEAGACYTVNSVAIADIATKSLNPNETGLFPITCKFSPMFCSVLLESNVPYSYYIHSNYDIVDITTRPYDMILSQVFSTNVDVVTTRDGRGVYDLEPTRRGCRYTTEPVENRKVFSTNTCRLSCRSKLAVRLCKCKPFYYFYQAEGEVCGVAGMACLSAHTHVLANNAGARCPCAQQCVDAAFKEVFVENKYWDQGQWSNRASFKVVVQTPRTRYTREIIFLFQDLIVSFGGAAGLFLGASFISFIEIFYFFLERFLTFCTGSATRNEANKPNTDQSKMKQSRVSYETERMIQLTKILESQNQYEHRKHMQLYY